MLLFAPTTLTAMSAEYRGGAVHGSARLHAGQIQRVELPHPPQQRRPQTWHHNWSYLLLFILLSIVIHRSIRPSEVRCMSDWYYCAGWLIGWLGWLVGSCVAWLLIDGSQCPWS